MLDASSIPIKNIFQMLCYAWKYFPSSKKSDVSGAEEVDSVQNLLAKCFIFALRELRRNGLRRDYVEETSEGPVLKGKLKVAASLQKGLLTVGRMSCEHDSFSSNSFLNQVIKTTAEALTTLSIMSRDIKNDLYQEVDHLGEVSSLLKFDRHVFPIRLGRHDQDYRVIISICELIWAQLAPDSSRRGFRFFSFIHNEALMRQVFELFIRNFFAMECGHIFSKVKAETMRWWPEDGPVQTAHLPVLRTDTSLIGPDRYIVIETKYTPRLMDRSNHVAIGREKLRSQHLYQLLSYLENIRQSRGRTPEGILLYPLAHKDIQETYRIWSFQVQVRCLNLNQDWQGVRRDLLALVA